MPDGRRRTMTLAAVIALVAGCTARSAPQSESRESAGDGGASMNGDGGAGGADGGLANDGAATTDGPTDGAVGSSISATFRTLQTSQYLSAVGGGGSTMNAAAASAGSAETFALTDVNRGALVDGDDVYVAAANGSYLSAANGGGGALNADGATPGANEAFVITRLDGPGTIVAGDRVALKTKQKVAYVSAINGGDGDVRADAPWARAWETFTITLGGTTPPTSSPRQKVLDYIAGVSGHKTITGQHNKFNSSPAISSDWIKAHTGKQPGLWSADFGFGADAINNRGRMIAEAKNQWSHGAIVQLMYHNCIPTRDELCGWDEIGGSNPQHLSDAQWSELVTDGTALNAAWKQRLDALSVFFADLKAAGVAPLFRPLHEMNQGAFWWGGRGGSNGTRKLYQITHDYLVGTKGFDHIIWVWDIQDFGSLATDVNDYYPGDAYYDIAALDVYGGGYDTSKYDAMVGRAGSKPIAIGECATPPTSALLAQQPRWVFFMLWPDFLDQNASTLPALYTSSNVVNEDVMPGWH